MYLRRRRLPPNVDPLQQRFPSTHGQMNVSVSAAAAASAGLVHASNGTRETTPSTTALAACECGGTRFGSDSQIVFILPRS